MASLGVDAGSDLGPWAAYVVGRHPYALADWHAESWSMIRDSGTIPDRGHLYGSPQELGELDEALKILAHEGRTGVSELDSFRRSMGRFVAVSKEIYENSENPLYGSEEIDWEAESAPGSFDLSSMMVRSSKLVTGPEELRLWERCGAIIGESLLPPRCLISAWRWESPREWYHAFLGAIQKLAQTGEYPFLAELAGHLPELDPQAVLTVGSRHLDHAKACRQRLAEMDVKLRDALLSQAPPKVWLEFDGERLIFFDARYYGARLPRGEKAHDGWVRLPRAEAAFLWVLVDRLGEDVSREVIQLEGEIGGEVEELTVISSRLRGKLKPAIEAYCAKRGCTLPEHAIKCFIVGEEDGYSNGPYERNPGPYTLKLPPHRVRVSPGEATVGGPSP